MVAPVPTRAVIFDLFDTLVDLRMDRLAPVTIGGRRAPGTTHQLHETLALEYPMELARFTEALLAVDQRWRDGGMQHGVEFATTDRFAQVLDVLGVGDTVMVETLTQVHMAALRNQAIAVPHHREVLGRLAQRVGLGLCSNFSHTPTVLSVLEEAGLRGFFDDPVVSVDLGIRKPRREIFEATLERLGVEPAEAIHVGDNLGADVAGAAPLGIRTIWITRRVADLDAARASYAGPAPTWIVDDLSEIDALLDA
jgi:putative hydrolase of the HAD superfamily